LKWGITEVAGDYLPYLPERPDFMTAASYFGPTALIVAVA